MLCSGVTTLVSRTGFIHHPPISLSAITNPNRICTHSLQQLLPLQSAALEQPLLPDARISCPCSPMPIHTTFLARSDLIRNQWARFRVRVQKVSVPIFPDTFGNLGTAWGWWRQWFADSKISNIWAGLVVLISRIHNTKHRQMVIYYKIGKALYQKSM